MGSYKRQVCAIPGNVMYKTINLHMLQRLQVLREIDFCYAYIFVSQQLFEACPCSQMV